jgi:hypothetical protein
MVPTIIGLLLTLVVIIWLQWSHTEGFGLPVPGHQEYVEDSQKKLNALTNLVNLTDPVVPVKVVTAKDMYQATSHLEAKPTGTLHALSSDAAHEVPDALPVGLERAIGCQKAPKTCAAFDSAEFAENCGMSFDKQGVGSDGKPHIGGMYVAPDDRAYQITAAQKVVDERQPPYDPYRVYQPSIGAAKAGAFALTKDQCVVVKEKIDCDEKQTFNSPNCTQCFPSQSFTRVAKDTPRIPFTLYLAGNGVVRVSDVSDTKISLSLAPTQLDPNKPITLKIPADAEGVTFTISVSESSLIGPPLYLSGYLEGNTGRGPFKVDMNLLIAKDAEMDTRPRIMGMKTVQGFRCLSFFPGPKKKQMRLMCMIPLSFLSPYEPDAIYCDNGPLITTAASATHVESDPCYGKKNAPGNYKLECLQSRWVALGGLPEGQGYPTTQAKADAIQRVGGRALNLDQIMDQLSVKMMEAITGQRESGEMMTIPEWNDASMWGLGIPIKSPCDGLQKDEGPLSKACLNYLYENRGTTSHVGSTFTLPTQMASLKEGFALPGGGLKEGFGDLKAVEGFAGANEIPNTFLYPGTAIDPVNPSGVAFGQGLGGVEAAKQELDRIHRQANDNTRSNAERAKEVKQAYGVELPPPSTATVKGPVQVFAVGPDYRFTKGEAAGVCAKYGAAVATTAQLTEAQQKGADWCFHAWVADENNAPFPITTNPIQGCGNRQGVIGGVPGSGRAGVNCYGPKPSPTDAASGVIKPFNGDMWDQPSEKTYITIPSGYLETSGPQPACFSGLSPDDAKKGCDRLGAQCAGFSYSKDGTGAGCYKGNHSAGMNRNGAYMGYVKIPSAANEPVDGRYIRLDYNRAECLNLAQILVFSSEGGPNVITPSTRVTKSSGFQGDQFPSGNFVNQRGSKHYNFVHTSCSDVPWIEVDLGSMMRIHKVVVWNRTDCCQSRILGTVLSILNEEKEKVYIANPIRTTNSSYTWMPPNGEVMVDRDPVRSQKAFTPTDWKCVGGFGAPMMRTEDGEIACMSYNAKDCLWGGSCSQTVANANRGAIRPLVCGADHASKWGGSGYNEGGHWCTRVDKMI